MKMRSLREPRWKFAVYENFLTLSASKRNSRIFMSAVEVEEVSRGRHKSAPRPWTLQLPQLCLCVFECSFIIRYYLSLCFF
jgi:hypothetical protein